jgi:hypothetical protein
MAALIISTILLLVDRISAARHRAYMRGEPWWW